MLANSRSRYASVPLVHIEGASTELLQRLKTDILQVTLEESLHLPGMFTVVINNPYVPTDTETQTWQYDSILQIGKAIKIGFRASTTDEFPEEKLDAILEGEITAIETHFTRQTQAPIVIRGYDLSHRLHRGRHNRSFQDISDRDLVKKIAREVGFQDDRVMVGNAPASQETHTYLFQENQSNMEFLRDRAARIGHELFVQNGKLHFRQPQEGETLKLQWLKDFESFRTRVTSAEQVDSVEVRSWNYNQKQPLVSTANKAQIITETRGQKPTNNPGFTNPNATPLKAKMIVVDKPASTPNEPKYMAQALCDELQGEFIYADGRAPGNPDIRVGKVVELEKMGRYDGKYYITETRHEYYQGIYTTEFRVRGLRGGSILNTLSPGNRLKPGQTHLIGIVTDHQDPEGLGRVRVKFPTLNPEADGSSHASEWARVVSVGAGSERGCMCLPEINDEVLVAFEHGDIHRPYILGALWNGQDKPPLEKDRVISKQGKVRLRTFKSRAPHELQFIEEDQDSSQKGVLLRTSSGHQLYLNDSENTVVVTTAQQQRLILDDKSSKITLETANGHQIVLDRKGITFNSAGALEIKATGVVNIASGAQSVTVAGNVSCTTVNCTAVTAGTVVLGTGATAVNVGDAIAKLQNTTPTNSTQS